jgi:hypothetical protein
VYNLFSSLFIAFSILVFAGIISCAGPGKNSSRPQPPASMDPAGVPNLFENNSIRLDSPITGAVISSPLTIKGKARGTWFFEGDFPVILLDAQGKKIAENYATAHGEWMTEDFVEFEGALHFSGALSGQKGIIVLKKDNPTGMEQFDDALKIPITFE